MDSKDISLEAKLRLYEKMFDSLVRNSLENGFQLHLMWITNNNPSAISIINMRIIELAK